MPITKAETPEEATSRRKRKRAADRHQDPKLAAAHDASRDHDKALRAERKLKQRRAKGRPTRKQYEAKAQARTDHAEAERLGPPASGDVPSVSTCPKYVHKGALWGSDSTNTCAGGDKGASNEGACSFYRGSTLTVST